MTGPADRDPVLMAVADGRSARLRHEIAGLETPAMRGDCLAVMLASDFEAWADEDEETDDSGTWKQSAVDATDGVLDTITGLCRDAIYAALLSERRRAEEAKWLPIDSAPKDGTQLIIARFQWLWDTGDAETGSALWRARIFGGEGATRKYHRCWVTGGFWSSKWNNWNDGIEPSGLSNPTHFLPMPVDALPLTPEPTHER